MPKWDDAGDAIRQVIRAYHGSPYDWDKFDASKIGTGEGAQAYGHGLYFAQSPSVAQEYKKQAQLIRPNIDGAWSKQTIRDAEDSVAKAGSREEAIRHLNVLLESVAEDVSLRPQVEDAIAYLQNGKPPKPRMYEVEIAHPEESLLDYDAPWSAQPPAVNKAVRKLAVGLPDEPPAEAIFGAMVNNEPGGVVYHRLAGALGENAELWRRPYREIAGHSARMASQALGEQGIPGIRYLDGLSRNAGQGTRNYVMFPGTEDSIRILRKYAVPGAIGAGAAAQGGGE
jgi:hypothetical protein